MNNQAKIAELKKNINNKFFPEALKPKLLAQIEKLEAEDKQAAEKGILPHPKPKQSKTSIAKIDGMPKFVIGDIVVLKGETTLEKEIIDRRMNNKNQYVYKAKYVSKPLETGEWNEEFQDKMSDADFAFTTLGKIVAADKKAWDETKVESGQEIRNSEKLTKLYATSLEKSLKDLKVKKNSLTEKEYDYLVDNNYHLLNEFLFWNDFYENDLAKGQKEMYQRLFNDKSNHSSVANPDWITVGKGILPHPKPKKPKTVEEVQQLYSKLKAGDTITFTIASNKPEVLVGRLENRPNYGLITVVDGKEYQLKKLLEVELIPKPKKPTVARTVKSELKKYYAHREIKTVTVIEDEKKVVYKGEDVLNGAQFLAKGGKVEEMATYYPIRAILEVTLDNGEKVKPANGYHIKNGAKPVAELGAALATEEIINNSIVDYHNPRFAYAEGGKLKESKIDFHKNDYEKLVGDSSADYPFYSIKTGSKQKIFDDKTEKQIAVWDSEKNQLDLQKATPELLQWLKNNSYLREDDFFEDGGEVSTSGSGDFDHIKFLDFVQPKVAATLLENNVTLLNDYTIVHEGKEFEPVIIYKGIDGKANALSVGYFADNDPQLKLLLSIDFELEEMEYHIRSKGWNINDVDMYAKGGWVKDHKYLNKAESYEMRYAKGKNRKGYMAKGGEVEFKDLSVELSAKPNPDFDRYSHEGSIEIKPKKVKVKSIEEAVSKVRSFINDKDLGAGNFTGGALYDGNTKIGRISYNGRVWDIDGNQMFAKGGNVDGFDYKNKYEKSKIKKLSDVRDFFKYLHNVEKISFHPDDQFEGNMSDNFTKEQAINLDNYMSDCFNVCEKENVEVYGEVLLPMLFQINESVGRKAKGVSVKQIADMHNVTEKYLRKQLARGQKVELEHTTDEAVAYAIAKDHIYENPEYYILLEKIEMKAKGGEVKTSKFKLNDIVVPEKGGKVDKGILPHPKPKRQGSQIFAKAAEIREPGERWQEAVRRANLLLKK